MDEPLSNLTPSCACRRAPEVSRLQRRLGTTMVYVTHDQVEALTLGDRVAVMRTGVLQQVASPKELYERPVNLFVAGFIGSPAMNFMAGTLEEGMLRTSLGEFRLSDRLRREVESSGTGREVIVGLRPENFEDVALVSPDNRPHGITFHATIDVLESLGSDVFVYFSREVGQGVSSAELEDNPGLGTPGLGVCWRVRYAARSRPPPPSLRAGRRALRTPGLSHLDRQRPPCSGPDGDGDAASVQTVSGADTVQPARTAGNVGRSHGHRHPGRSRPGRPGRGGYLTFRRRRSMISSFHSWVRMSRYRSAAIHM